MTGPLDAQRLFGDHRPALKSFLRRMTGNGDVADDLCQEVFVRAIHGTRRYQERGQAKAWLFSIARRLVIDHHRRSARRPEPKPLSSSPPRPVDPSQPLAVAIDAALASIDPDQREAFLLREVGGFGYREIAEALGTTPDAARSRIHRARLALREHLSRPLERERTTPSSEITK